MEYTHRKLKMLCFCLWNKRVKLHKTKISSPQTFEHYFSIQYAPHFSFRNGYDVFLFLCLYHISWLYIRCKGWQCHWHAKLTVAILFSVHILKLWCLCICMLSVWSVKMFWFQLSKRPKQPTIASFTYQ